MHTNDTPKSQSVEAGPETDRMVIEAIGFDYDPIPPVSTRTQSAMSILIEHFAYGPFSFRVWNGRLSPFGERDGSGMFHVEITDKDYKGGRGSAKTLPLAACRAILNVYEDGQEVY